MYSQAEEKLYEHYLPGYLYEEDDSIRDDIWWNSPTSVRYELLVELQKLRGEGISSISVDDCSRYDVPFVDWPDLLSMDIPVWRWSTYVTHHDWDETAEKLEKKMHQPTFIKNIPEGYTCQFDQTEFKLFYDNQLVSGLISTAFNVISRLATELISDWAATRNLHQRDVNVTWHKHEAARNSQLFEQLENIEPMAFVIKGGVYDCLQEFHFIFSNSKALRTIRPGLFVQDVKAMQSQSVEILQELAEQLADTHKEWCLDQGY